mgnify:CR=1 FL=1
MKRFLIVVIILTISVFSYSQKNARPKPVIIKNDNELFEAIKKDRDIVRQRINSGGSSLDEYLDKYHSFRYRSNKIYILNFDERLIAQFGTGDFEGIIDDINKNKHIKRRNVSTYYSPSHLSPLIETNEASVKSFSQRTLDNIKNSNLSDYEKELLTLYFKSTISKLYNDFYDNYFDQIDINNQSKALIPFAKSARQKAFIQRKIIAKPKSDILLAYSFDALNTNIYTGNYSKYLYHDIHLLGISINVIKKHVYFNFGASWYDSELKNDIPNNELWIKGEEISVSQYELGAGYPLILSRRLIVAPLVNITYFTYDLTKIKSKTQAQTTFNIGGNLYFKFSPKMQRVSDKIRILNFMNYIPNSIKVSAAYQPMFNKDGLDLNGGAFIFSLGLGVF